MAITAIDLTLCVGCGMCENHCPMDVIRFDPAVGVPHITYPQDCMLCKLCALKCPAKAITVTPEKKYDRFLAWG